MRSRVDLGKMAGLLVRHTGEPAVGEDEYDHHHRQEPE
jgi:hypothetical protein